MVFRVEEMACTEKPCPPIAGVRIGRQRMAHPDHIAAIGIQGAVGVIGNVQRWQRATKFERKWMGDMIIS